MRKELLQEDEDHRRHQQIEDEPVEADIAGESVARTDLHRSAAAPQRQQGERDADRAHQLFAVEDKGDQPEGGRKDHPRIER
jgi:hypothetical protein